MRLFKKTVAMGLAVAMMFSGVTYTEKAPKRVEASQEGLIWSDEFNGTSLDTSIWSYDIGNGDWGWGNGEVEYYTNRKDNVTVEDGYLKLIAKKENYGGQKYTSGRILTKGKKAVLYGKIEARIKVDNGNQDGVWPAFWMMGNNMANGVGWPYCGEIDIMEHANSNNYVGGCLHWNTDGLNGAYSHGSYGSGFEGARNSFGYFSDNVNNGINGWHIYGLIWDENHMEWQLDGQTYLSQNITDNNAYCFQKEQFFLFNLAIGGTGTGFTNNKTANANTFKTTTMYVDYLRVYELGSAGSVGETPTDKESPTSQPTTAPTNETSTGNADTETVVHYETEDAVEKSSNVFGTYFGGENGWGSLTGTISNVSNKGINIHLNSLGTNLWEAQTFLRELDYIPGNTYKFKCTLTSDVTKSVRIKVVGDSDDYIFNQDDITVKAGVPYNYEVSVTIPEDYDQNLNLYFGLAKNHFVDEKVDSNASANISISNTSFVTNKKIVTVVEKTTAETTTAETTTDTAPVTTERDSAKEIESIVKAGTAKIKVSVKKRSAKKIKITLKKALKAVDGYEVRVYKTRKNARKNKKAIVKIRTKSSKKTFVISKKKFKKKQSLFIRVRGYKKLGKKTIYSKKWSVAKKVKIK